MVWILRKKLNTFARDSSEWSQLFLIGPVIASNQLLGITGSVQWISVLTGLIMAASVVAMALGFEAMHADCKIGNRAAAQGSFGTILSHFSALTLTLVVIGLWSIPAYRLTRNRLRTLRPRPFISD